MVDVRHEGKANEHTWPSFPVSPSHKGCIHTSVLAPTDNRNSTTASWPAYSNETREYLAYKIFCQPKVMMQQTSHGCIEEGTPVVMETTPQSRWSTHKHCISQCTSVEPPSSSSRPPPLLVSISSTLVLQRKRYWIKNVLT